MGGWLLHTQATVLVWVSGSGRELRGSAWRLQKKHPTWASQSNGFVNDTKGSKLTANEQGVRGCLPASLEQKPHFERTAVWPMQEERASADRDTQTLVIRLLSSPTDSSPV